MAKQEITCDDILKELRAVPSIILWARNPITSTSLPTI